MSQQDLATLVLLRRVRDRIDRDFASPLDVPAMARGAHMSVAHFSRQFHAAYGETPYGYLMTRRIERAMALLRAGWSVTDTCMAVGCTSLGSFSARFTEIVGESPSAYRRGEHTAVEAMPSCTVKSATRPARSIPAGGSTPDRPAPADPAVGHPDNREPDGGEPDGGESSGAEPSRIEEAPAVAAG